MDPTLLRTFVTVARCASFSGAARELQYTQSAVSQQIASLEDDLGAPLLHRRPVAVTDAGARLLEHAGAILLRLDAARADVARAVAAAPERLVIGGSALALSGALATALAEVRRELPRLDLTVVACARDLVADGVARGQFELGLLDGIVAAGDPLRVPEPGLLAAIGIGERPLAVALPAGHPLAGRPGLRLEDLIDARWIDAPDVAAPLVALRRASAGTAGTAVAGGPRVATTFRGHDRGALQALVAAGHGLAVLPDDPATVPGVRLVPLTSPPLVHRTELLHGRLGPGPARRVLARLSPGPHH